MKQQEQVLDQEWKDLVCKALAMGIKSTEIREFLSATAAMNRKERLNNGE